MIKLRDILFVLFLINAASSCVPHRELLYFRRDEAVRQIDSTALSVQNYSPLKIQKNDVLSITVRSFDQDLALPFNIALDKAGMTQTASPLNTFQVDENGAIDFPVLGEISLLGKTINEAKDTLDLLLQDYLEEPSINLRLVSFKVSVLGEVRNPGTFSINSDRVTLLEALALAQDLTPYANATNVLVIREQDGNRTFGEVNLQSTNFISSEYYYLKQGDVIYIEPRKDKRGAVRDDGREVYSIIALGAQVLVGIGTLIVIANQ